VRLSDSVWQGNFGYRQNNFIHTNLLVIGYTAWQGFESFGREVVICDVDTFVTYSTMTNLDTIPFTLQFMPASLIEFYLRSQSTRSSIISDILPAVATYNPHQGIVLMLKARPQFEVNFLYQLKMGRISAKPNHLKFTWCLND
jgi:hypothetical protein